MHIINVALNEPYGRVEPADDGMKSGAWHMHAHAYIGRMGKWANIHAYCMHMKAAAKQKKKKYEGRVVMVICTAKAMA